MSNIVINGSRLLSGEIKISGAKNSVVALIPASILCDEVISISNVPNISDIDALVDILNYLDVDVSRDKDTIQIDSKKMKNKELPCELSSKLRASYYFMGALLTKYKSVRMCFPGGCSIGKRPIDFHLKGFQKMGVQVEENDGSYILYADKLRGADICLDTPSVGATINLVLAAVKAEGTTVIDNAAREPHVVDVCNFLNSMGANIQGMGTSKIVIQGVSYLHTTKYLVVPDMIEAGTYVIIASLLGNKLKISNLNPVHIECLISKLMSAGVEMEIGSDFVIVDKIGEYQAIDIKTLVYPGFPTDLQQVMVPFMVSCHGDSKIEETIYENRFMNIPDTVKMGASIDVVENRYAIIHGKSNLVGTHVVATDLRGGASMVICGLIASGKTVISNVDHILRGYEDIVGKLSGVGADIKIVD